MTFDPFMYLSLPLPQNQSRVVSVIMHLKSRLLPVRYGVRTSNDASIVDLKVIRTQFWYLIWQLGRTKCSLRNFSAVHRFV